MELEHYKIYSVDELLEKKDNIIKCIGRPLFVLGGFHKEYGRDVVCWDGPMLKGESRTLPVDNMMREVKERFDGCDVLCFGNLSYNKTQVRNRNNVSHHLDSGLLFSLNVAKRYPLWNDEQKKDANNFMITSDNHLIDIAFKRKKKKLPDVVGLLSSKIERGERPKVQVVCPMSKNAYDDLIAGLDDAKGVYDISNKSDVITYEDIGSQLKDIDKKAASLLNAIRKADVRGTDVVCLTRGGGDYRLYEYPNVLHAINDMSTPVIGAIGHAHENLLAQLVFDAMAPTPSLLGVCLRDLAQD